MNHTQNSKITHILQDWNDGDEDAKERPMPFVYDELKRQARILMQAERSDHTLQPTALVHEAFIRISKQSGIDWENRKHFFAIASRLMRQIPVDHARARTTAKCGGEHPIRFSIDDLNASIEKELTRFRCFTNLSTNLPKLTKDRQRLSRCGFSAV